mmetsp:Transcript_21062/g.32000  ORF Transcript_21062/g.32000 Transcript_21062/m.32000 type:complete len:112 (+) Transcript_21062:1818-2153(+)
MVIDHLQSVLKEIEAFLAPVELDFTTPEHAHLREFLAAFVTRKLYFAESRLTAECNTYLSGNLEPTGKHLIYLSSIDNPINDGSSTLTATVSAAMLVVRFVNGMASVNQLK